MTASSKKALEIFSPTRIFITILIGLSVAFYLVYKDFDSHAFAVIDWGWQNSLWIFVALCMMAIRDLAYMYRIRVLTNWKLNLKQSFDVIMLWEFASAITPSVVGGSGVAIYFINKEGVSVGKSTAVVMVSALLDELFYVLMVPLVLLSTGLGNLFPTLITKQIFGMTLGPLGIFIVGYLFIFLLTCIIAYAIFFRPRGFKYLLIQFFKIPFLKKWRYAAIQTGDDIIITSIELKGQPAKFWLKAGISTFLAWTARFWVVNFIILAFIPVSEHLLIYARQLVMWVIMLISPTPGGAGVAEYIFTAFLNDFIPVGLIGSLALLWRLISYYPYLFIGAIILPGWIRRTHSKTKVSDKPENDKELKK